MTTERKPIFTARELRNAAKLQKTWGRGPTYLSDCLEAGAAAMESASTTREAALREALKKVYEERKDLRPGVDNCCMATADWIAEAILSLIPQPAAQPSREGFEAMREALRRVMTLLSAHANDGKSAAVREINVTQAWHVARTALADKPEQGETT